MEIINILKDARRRKGYTQEFVAYKLGISSKAYSKIETGINRLNSDYLIPLCKILNLPQKEMALMFFGILEREEMKMMNTQYKETILEMLGREEEEIIVLDPHYEYQTYKNSLENSIRADNQTKPSLIISNNYEKEMDKTNNNV